MCSINLYLIDYLVFKPCNVIRTIVASFELKTLLKKFKLSFKETRESFENITLFTQKLYILDHIANDKSKFELLNSFDADFYKQQNIFYKINALLEFYIDMIAALLDQDRAFDDKLSIPCPRDCFSLTGNFLCHSADAMLSKLSTLTGSSDSYDCNCSRASVCFRVFRFSIVCFQH